MALRRVVVKGAPALWDAPFGRWDALLRPWSYTRGGIGGEMNNMFDDFFDSATAPDAAGVTGASGGGGFFGATRSYENKNGDLVIRVDLPGVKKGDLQVSAQNGSLRIHGKRRIVFADEDDENGNGASASVDIEGDGSEGKPVSRKSRQSGEFAEIRHSFAVPKEFDTAKIAAKLEDGILAVTVPKVPAEQNARRVISVE
mmetsp:Transcript_16539/g.35937  ORF Transcript_16539/g.35937 Transcript_16539/m.35937 type:complete len:200 (-) Transcript_16539:186-785(-)|eukprot:CAMPEP_0185850742 /NCGR_PEP_ID=MMETSP1354-20130828/4764_1 /TAXON_ID=708628 /ORGANISM="Erythrolobus madagascarensis, Strain CCMP3276" /LENGTH=199 /DNA_ID=CAMNT_0028551455 /DNA_START=243 /DNA_END=842 /DNA_ORIENTATION=-